MKCLPRLLPCVALACSLSFPMLYGSAARAQTAPADNSATPPAATAPADTAAPPATAPAAPEAGAGQSLNDQVDDFWHYGEIGRYDMQAAIGKKLIAQGQQNPEDLLKTFEKVSSQHHRQGIATDLDAELLRWQAADPQMQDVATQLLETLNKGRFSRRQNPQYISDNIHRLNQGERAYMLAMQQLRNSGELAVPQMVAILVSQNPEDVQLHDVVRRGLVDLGRAALNPLLAATEMNPQNSALTTICGVLGDIGYPIAGPYLVELVHNPNASAAVKDAAGIALRRLNVNPNGNGGDMFYDLGEKFYYGTASIQPDPRSPRAFVWSWDDKEGLTNKAVPPQIFDDVMTMREMEHALRQNPSRADQAIALWLASNIRRTVDLPQGETDPTRGQSEPSAHYYNVAEGAKYLNLALDRSLKDNTPQSPAVALAAIKSLQNIVGQSNLFTGAQGQPLVEAMRYPDRQVRYEAAFALAAALPQKPFQGQDRVVPLLAEAVSQSGTPGVLIVGPQNDRTRLAADLKNYAVAGGADPSSAVADAGAIPAVDVILMSEDLGNPEIDRVISLASQNPGLERAAKLIIVHSLASPWARMAITDPTISYTEATGGEPLVSAIEQARKKAGGLPMDQKVATDFALRAANLLARLAISRGQVLDLNASEQPLVAALGDKRPQIVQAVGEAVALLNSPRAQGALADRANDASSAPEIRVSLYRSLATSAKFYGNRLEGNQLGDLQQVVANEKNLDIRSAAAEARGALNLPAADAKALILQRHD